VRVDEDRAPELLRSTRELAQHQHAGAVDARRHVLLRHQVHPVAQGRDQADVRLAIEARQERPVVGAVEIADRRPVRLPQLTVDAAEGGLDTAALLRVIDAGAFDSAQVVYNMLNPSAAVALPPHYPAQDYGRLFDHTSSAGTGVIGIRVLAGGALSGSAERHPVASPPPEPIGSSLRYDADLARARRLMPLVNEGFAKTLAEAATRFAISHPAVGTILVGMATPQQFEDALAAVQQGPLPQTALDRVAQVSAAFAGEPR